MLLQRTQRPIGDAAANGTENYKRSHCSAPPSTTPLSATPESEATLGDPVIAQRTEQYELAFRMQSSVPGLTDLSDESASRSLATSTRRVTG